MAFRLLRAHIDELLDTDNMHGACVVAVEFVNMMAAVDRRQEGARILGYIETAGMLDTPVWRAQVARARQAVGTAQDSGDLDNRAALEYMRAALA